MNKIKFTVLAIVAAFATTATATDIEFHGYTRIGIALNSNGGTGACFRLFTADADYRLGNECDYVVEPNFEVTMAKLDDKSTWGFHLMPSVYKRWQPMDGRDLDTLTVKFGQVYFFGNNIPWLANGSIWAGRKFWDRLQLGINDQFVENEDGESFGVENMDLGVAKLSIGVGLGKDGCSAGSNICPATGSSGYAINPASFASRRYKIAARLTGIQTMNKDSSLQLWAGYYGTYSNEDIAGEAQDAGYRIALYHNFGFGSAGNLFVGAKLHKNDGISGMDGNDGNGFFGQPGFTGAQQWRVFAQYGVAVPSIRTSFDFLTEYRDSKPSDDGAPDVHAKWFTAGARADAQISGPFRFLLEAGYDRAWTSGDVEVDPISLIKITPAIAISAGNDPWSRPTFRLYYTYATWTDPADVGITNSLDNGWHSQGVEDVFEGETSGSSFGIQAEGWW